MIVLYDNKTMCTITRGSRAAAPVSPSERVNAMPRRVSNAEGMNSDDDTSSFGDNSVEDSSAYSSTPLPPVTTKRRKSRCALAKHHPHIMTKHDYHDHAADPVTDVGSSSSSSPSPSSTSSGGRNGISHHPCKGGSTMAFPVKLYEMLLQVEEEGLSRVVSWQPHGRCFVVHDPVTFKQLLPNYFKLSKIASFQRQLNLYGFQRLTVGLDKGSYYHERFLRNRPDLVSLIQRVKVKGTGVRAKSNPKEEPNLYLYPAVDHVAATAVTSGPVVSSTMPDQQQLPAVVPSAYVMPHDLSFSDVVDVEMDAVRYTEWTYQHQPHPTHILRNISSLDDCTDGFLQSTRSLFRNVSFHVVDELQEPMNLQDDDVVDMFGTKEDVSFDLLIDEMFLHDQSLDFSDLLKLAAV